MNRSGIKPWTLVHGASWLRQDGSILPVAGFHEDWLRAHADIVDGASNVCEVVLRKGWLSVTVFDEGYVELLVPSRTDASVLALVERLLAANRGSWSRALVMSMDAEGYSLYHAADLGPEGHLTPSAAI